MYEWTGMDKKSPSLIFALVGRRSHSACSPAPLVCYVKSGKKSCKIS
jgi:hypothetical protein